MFGRYLINNATFESLVEIVKKDIETSKVIPAANIGFKVRNTDTGEYVVQHINYPTPMDTSSARDEDLSATTFLATVFIRDEMSKSRTRKKAVFGDELWIIAGKEGNEQASEFVIKLVKTIRGYGGIFVSCTQNTIDYFALNSGKFGDAVLNNSRLKLLLQMEEPEALKLKEKVGLSDEEVMQILRCGRGQGLLCAGKNRIAVEIRSSETQYDLITTNRADLEKREIK